jgi:hypothetical protein
VNSYNVTLHYSARPNTEKNSPNTPAATFCSWKTLDFVQKLPCRNRAGTNPAHTSGSFVCRRGGVYTLPKTWLFCKVCYLMGLWTSVIPMRTCRCSSNYVQVCPPQKGESPRNGGFQRAFNRRQGSSKFETGGTKLQRNDDSTIHTAE